MPWVDLSTLPDPTQGSCMHLSWGACFYFFWRKFMLLSCPGVRLFSFYHDFVDDLWTSTGFWNRMFASGKGDPYSVCSYFILMLAVCHRFPMLLICWRVHLWSLSLASLRYDFFFLVICLLDFCGVFFGVLLFFQGGDLNVVFSFLAS